MDQQAIINDLQHAFRFDRSVKALFLAGSLGRGAGDPQSDIDFIAIVRAEDQPAFLDAWRAAIHAISPVVHWRIWRPMALLANAVAADWTRIDVNVLEPSVPLGSSQDRLRPLLDRDGVYPTLPPTSPVLAPDGTVVARLVTEFIRVLGLTHVVVARGEMIAAEAGVSMLRDLLIQLMKQEVAVPDGGGMLHLATLLPPDRMRLLEALP